jgi:DNA-binding CsgD family transcriptional regulator
MPSFLDAFVVCAPATVGRRLDERCRTKQLVFLSAPQARHLVTLRDTSGGDRPCVSEREVEVVALVGDGLSNREIAAKLWISEKTAKSHIGHVLRRTGSRNRAHLVARFVRGQLHVGLD